MDSALAIASADVWEAAQTSMRGRGSRYSSSADGRIKTPQARSGGVPHLLSGFLECEGCGRAVHDLNNVVSYGWHQEKETVLCPHVR